MSDLALLPASALAELVRSRSVSAREVATAALERMETVNPAINAVVDPMADEALAAADAVDAQVARGEDPGPLAGVPATVKINVDMAGRATTNGLKLQADLIAAEDSPPVRALRRAGAVILGRTNTPAFSIRWFTRNGLHGATRNPHDAGLTPGGSSGGAGAAVAAGIGAVAHGTDIAGSIRYPAYACGVHGLRPSLGRVAQANLSGPDRTMGAQITAVSGPLARRIEDIALALRAMEAEDPRDIWWAPTPTALPPVAKRCALALAPEGMATDPAVADALRAAARSLEARGWTVEERDPPSFAEAARINMALWMADFRTAGLPKLDREADPDAAFVALNLMRIAGEHDPFEALRARVAITRAWYRFLADWPLLLCPVSAERPFADHSDLESEAAFDRIYAAQATQVGLPVLGLPGLTVATGTPGKPMGVHLIAGRFREDLLVEAGRAIEAECPPIAPVAPFATA
ncbi:MAG: amidase [Paracoccaceae bacterium]